MVEYIELKTSHCPLDTRATWNRDRSEPTAPTSPYPTQVQLGLKILSKSRWKLFVLCWVLFVVLNCMSLPELAYIRPEWSDFRQANRNPLLEYVRIRSRRLGYDLTEAERFCTDANTTLDNCALNWDRILTEKLPQTMMVQKVTNETAGLYCVHLDYFEMTCFDTRPPPPNDTTSTSRYHVWTQKLDMMLEPRSEVHYHPKLILAHSPVEFILVTDVEDFCHLNLHDNECLHYDY